MTKKSREENPGCLTVGNAAAVVAIGLSALGTEKLYRKMYEQGGLQTFIDETNEAIDANLPELRKINVERIDWYAGNIRENKREEITRQHLGILRDVVHYRGAVTPEDRIKFAVAAGKLSRVSIIEMQRFNYVTAPLDKLRFGVKQRRPYLNVIVRELYQGFYRT